VPGAGPRWLARRHMVCLAYRSLFTHDMSMYVTCALQSDCEGGMRRGRSTRLCLPRWAEAWSGDGQRLYLPTHPPTQLHPPTLPPPTLPHPTPHSLTPGPRVYLGEHLDDYRPARRRLLCVVPTAQTTPCGSLSPMTPTSRPGFSLSERPGPPCPPTASRDIGGRSSRAAPAAALGREIPLAPLHRRMSARQWRVPPKHQQQRVLVVAPGR